MRIDRWPLLLIGAVNVLAPFRNVSVNIIEPPSIGFLLSDRMGLLVSIRAEPAKLPQLIGLSEIVRPIASGLRSVFPLGLGRQSITVGRVVAVPIHALLVVTGLQTFQERALVAILLGVAPADPLDRLLWIVLPA